IRSVPFGVPDGMRTTECSLQDHQPAGCRTADGRLWFTTKKGVVAVNPDDLPSNELPPPVLLERMLVGQKSFPADAAVRVPPGEPRVEFRYTGLSLRVPERVRFRYRLEGFDPDWVEADTRRVAYYTNLPPGRYRFQVIACNDDGVWNETGAS